MKQLVILLFAGLLASCQWSQGSKKETPYQSLPVQVVDYNSFSRLLSRFVVDGKINFELIKKEELSLLQVFDDLGKVDHKKLSKNQQLAYALNTYHAALLWLSVSEYPHIDTMLDIASCWDRQFIKWGKKEISLSQLKKEIADLCDDPALAVSNLSLCAKSGPGMIGQAYTPANVLQEMDARARELMLKELTVYEDRLVRSGFFSLYPDEFKDGRQFIKVASRWRKGLGPVRVMDMEFDWLLNKQ